MKELRKYLESHNDVKHEGKPLHYKSAMSRDISSMFGKVCTESSSGSSTCSTSTAVPINDEEEFCQDLPSKVSCLNTEVNDGGLKLAELSRKINKLSSHVDTLIDILNRQSRQEEPCRKEECSNVLNSDERRSLVSHAQGLYIMIKWLEYWAPVHDGLKCISCTKVINYDYETEGKEFEDEDKLPCSFRNMRTSVLRHLDSANHIKCP